MARSLLILVALVLCLSFVAAQNCTESDFTGKWKLTLPAQTVLNITTTASASYSLSSDNTYTFSGSITISNSSDSTTCTSSGSGTWSYNNMTQTVDFHPTACTPTTTDNSTAFPCPPCSLTNMTLLVQTSNCTLYIPGPGKTNIYLTHGGIAGWVIAIIVVGIVLVLGVVVGLLVYRRHKNHQRHIYETA